jgi:glycine cleavage system H protein
MIKIDDYLFDEELYYYTGGDGHVWIRKLDDGNIQVGFDDFGQKLAGKILFMRTIPAGKERKKGSTLGTIETGKYVGAIRCPVNGTIVEVNQEVKDNPGLINEDPYNKGWIAIIEPKALEEDLKTDIVYGEAALKEWMEEEIKEHVS